MCVYTITENIIPITTIVEFDLPPTIKELSKAIDSLACNKAPGNDGTPPPQPNPPTERSSKLARSALSSANFTRFCYSAGKKGPYPRACAMSIVPRSGRIKELKATGIPIVEYPSLPLCERPSPGASSTAYN